MYNLALERRFAHTAHKNMERICAQFEQMTDQTQSQSSLPGVVNLFAEIRTCAGKVKAMAVYRACLLCEDILERESKLGSGNFKSALLSLDTLIRQYNSGLMEIDPEFSPSQPVLETKADVSPSHNTDMHRRSAKQAASVLKPLISLAANDRDAKNLSFLANYRAEPAFNTSAPKVPAQQRPKLSFERLMSDVTKSTLRNARLMQKTVSLSYMADFQSLPIRDAQIVGKSIEHTLMAIINVIAKETAPQISISANTQPNATQVTIRWPGRGLWPAHIEALCAQAALGAITDRGGTISIQPESGPGLAEIHTIVLVVPNTPLQDLIQNATTKPLATPDLDAPATRISSVTHSRGSL